MFFGSPTGDYAARTNHRGSALERPFDADKAYNSIPESERSQLIFRGNLYLFREKIAPILQSRDSLWTLACTNRKAILAGEWRIYKEQLRLRNAHNLRGQQRTASSYTPNPLQAPNMRFRQPTFQTPQTNHVFNLQPLPSTIPLPPSTLQPFQEATQPAPFTGDFVSTSTGQNRPGAFQYGSV